MDSSDCSERERERERERETETESSAAASENTSLCFSLPHSGVCVQLAGGRRSGVLRPDGLPEDCLECNTRGVGVNTLGPCCALLLVVAPSDQGRLPSSSLEKTSPLPVGYTPSTAESKTKERLLLMFQSTAIRANPSALNTGELACV